MPTGTGRLSRGLLADGLAVIVSALVAGGAPSVSRRPTIHAMLTHTKDVQRPGLPEQRESSDVTAELGWPPRLEQR
jgi:hypothetical protein